VCFPLIPLIPLFLGVFSYQCSNVPFDRENMKKVSNIKGFRVFANGTLGGTLTEQRNIRGGTLGGTLLDFAP
jgi:hypothetical protein